MADTYQLWAEVYDATYTNKLGVGPIRLIQADASAEYNGVGSGSIETIPLDPEFGIRALDLLSSKVIVEIWTQTPGFAKRKVNSFIVDDVTYAHQTSGFSLSAAGTQTIDLLRNYTTHIAREYTNSTHNNVFNSLLSLAGWTRFSDGVSNTVGFSARFDGQSVLQCVRFIANNNGYTIRESTTTAKQLIISSNDTTSSVTLAYAKGDKRGIHFNDDVIMLERIEIVDDSRAMANWILPFGAGDGDAQLTLEDSTRDNLYTIETMTGPDGRTLYFLKDDTSIATYGQIERRLQFKGIAPIGVSSTSTQRGANVLYDAAEQWLSNNNSPIQMVYCSARNLQTTLNIGDKINLLYIEQVNHNGVPVTLKSIDDSFYIVSLSESLGSTGSTVQMALSSVAQAERTDGDIIVGGLEDIEINNVSYKPYYNIWSMGPYSLYSGSRTLTVRLNIPDDVLQVTNVTMIVDTYEDREITFAGSPVTLAFSDFTADAGSFPVLDIDVNGTTVASSVGSASAEVHDQEYDITDEIIGAGNDGRGSHTIEADFLAGPGGSGGVEIQFLIRGIVISGRVT